MKQAATKQWIEAFMASDPPRSKSLVMTIFGDAVIPHGGTAWVGSLIDLLAPFGVNDRLVRTSVFRLVQEGWLVASRDGRRSSYAILPGARVRFERANRRVFAPLTLHWDGSWTLLLPASGDVEAPQRAWLRKELLWAGYAMIAPGIFGHPASDAEVLEEILERVDLRRKLFVCHASALPGVSTRPLQDLVSEGWDLSAVIDGYRRFIDSFAPLLALVEQEDALDPAAAYVIRILLIHAYRRVQLHDPMLPVELLPEPWLGAAAYDLARTLYRRLHAGADEHVLAVLRREDAQAPEANAAYHERFGGLN